MGCQTLPRKVTIESLLEGQQTVSDVLHRLPRWNRCRQWHDVALWVDWRSPVWSINELSTCRTDRFITRSATAKGLMQGYGHQIKPAERWSIVHYVRALQRSRSATIDDVPEPFRSELIKNE